MRNLAPVSAIVLLASLSPPAARSQPAAGLPVQCSNTTVRWKAGAHPWPNSLWLFHSQITPFPPAVISNLAVLTGYTTNDEKVYGTSGVVFNNPTRTGNLRISYPEGSVEYWSARSYGPTNFAQGVPQTKQLIALASVLLPQLGISLPELSKTRAGHPKFTVFESPMEYRFGDTVVTNVESRSLRFTRALDGVEMYGDGGNGEIEFGGHARVMKISLSWRKVERYKSCITATPSTIVKWLRQGRATYRPADSRPHQAPIDWANVTKITIKSAQPFYWGQIYQSRKSPASLSYIRPYAALLATVETTKEHFDIAIQCPILDENDSRSAAVSHIPFGGSLATF